MRRSGLVVVLFIGALAIASSARAADPAPLPALPNAGAPGPAPVLPAGASAPSAGTSPPAAATQVAPTPPPTPGPNGVAVVAMAGATDAAWPLAQSVYSTASIRPYAVDEVHARVLCGEPASATSPADVHELGDTVAALRGEDAPSRAILADIARRLNVRALAVVHVEGGKPVARVFVAESQSFDAASYSPDAPTSGTGTSTAAAGVQWTAATASLSRGFGVPAAGAPVVGGPPAQSAPPLATHEEPVLGNAPPKPKAFYESGWFWGAVGAAAFAGGAVFFATRDNGPTAIHLDMQVPH